VTEKALSDTTTFVPDLLYADGRFERDVGLACDHGGRVVALLPLGPIRNLIGSEPRAGEVHDIRVSDRSFTTRFVRLRRRAMLPGMVNAHSHAFQRVIRGRTEHRSARAEDSFWTWREMMYAASARLTPEDIYDASRMAFLEMALGGITSVGEFHYLHRTPAGAEYTDPNLLAKEVVRAALDTGLRVALLRVAYARSGFRAPADERQRRFIEPDADTFIRNAESLARDIASDERAYVDEGARIKDEEEDAGIQGEGGKDASHEDAGGALRRAWVGVAPHSVRAVPSDYVVRANRFAVERRMPVHMHVAEQPAEVEACVEETGRTPLALLADEGVLGPHFTGVHVIHLRPESGDLRRLKESGARVCACPTTERNLGDGVVPADLLFDAGVSVALGTDSHAQIDLLEDARELEYNLRLLRLRRNVLAPPGARDESHAVESDEDARANSSGSDMDARADSGESDTSALAARLFECATLNGARSIGAPAGEFRPGGAADFFTVDLDDPSVAGAGAEDLLPAIVFSLTRAAVRETAVGGRLVVEGGRHAAQDEIVSRFDALQRRLWNRGRD